MHYFLLKGWAISFCFSPVLLPAFDHVVWTRVWLGPVDSAPRSPVTVSILLVQRLHGGAEEQQGGSCCSRLPSSTPPHRLSTPRMPCRVHTDPHRRTHATHRLLNPLSGFLLPRPEQPREPDLPAPPLEAWCLNRLPLTSLASTITMGL